MRNQESLHNPSILVDVKEFSSEAPAENSQDYLDIAIPYYGDVEFLKIAVMSVLAQSSDSWHLNIIDDQYPGDAAEVFVREINDSRITYIRNETNLGVSGNFDKCLELAQSDFVTIMGFDDALLPNYVERIRTVTSENPSVAMIAPGVEVIDVRGQVVDPLIDRVKARYRKPVLGKGLVGGEDLAASLLKGNWAYFPAMCWNRKVLSQYSFNPHLDVVQDLNVMLDIIADGGGMVVIPDVVFQYRRHSSSASTWRAADGSRFRQESQLFQEQEQRFSQLGWFKTARAARQHFSSRLSALSRIPLALKARDFAGFKVLFMHFVGAKSTWRESEIS